MTTGKPNRTLLGLPNDLQAVLQKLKDEEAARAGHGVPPPPAASAELGRTQYGNPHSSGEGAPPRPAQQPVASPGMPAMLSHQSSLNRTLIGMLPASAPVATQSIPAAGLAGQNPTAPAQSSLKPIVPVQVVQVIGLDAAAPSATPVLESRAVSGPDEAARSSAHARAASSAVPIATTRLAGFDTAVLGDDGSATAAVGSTSSASSDPEAAPRLALSQEQEQARPARAGRLANAHRPKRWPALSLLGLAVVTFGAVIVLRAPQLLPTPLAALVSSGSVEQDAPPPVPDLAAREPGVANSVRKEFEAETAVNGATAQPTTAATAVTEPVSPALTGAAAQLEKAAIDLLLANDYAAASKRYEQLRAQLPGRREYPLMIELLAHTVATATCGKPGQEPCVTQ